MCARKIQTLKDKIEEAVKDAYLAEINDDIK